MSNTKTNEKVKPQPEVNAQPEKPSIQLYESKPVQVRAIQYLTLENVQTIQRLLKGSAKFNDDFSIKVNKVVIQRGWWIVFDITGEFKTVMNPERFEKDYGKVQSK